jgi:hypothetical protein
MADKTEIDDELRVYVEVFGIPRKKCPPDYFTLFGLDQDCSDPEEIAAAAKQRASLLNKNLPAELHIPARKILRRMDRAKICLSDPQSRAAYLARLTGGTNLGDSTSITTQRIDSPTKRSSVSTLPALDLASLEYEDPMSSVGAVLDLGPTTDWVSKQPQKSSNAPLYIAAGVGGLIVVTVLAIALMPGGSANEELQAANVSPTESIDTMQPLVEPPTSSASQLPSSSNAQNEAPRPSPFRDVESVDNASERAKSKSVPDPSAGARSSLPQPEESKSEPAPLVQEVTAEVSLAGLEVHVELPSLEADDTTANVPADEADEYAKLGAVSNLTHQQLQLAIAQPTISRFPGIEFYVREDAESKATKQWQICLKSVPLKKTGEKEGDTDLDLRTAGFDKPVGQIGFSEGYLQFEWQEIEERSFAEQLRNCILIVTAGPEKAKIQLRPIKSIGQFLTDLSERNRIYELEGPALPAAEALQLRIKTVNLPGTDFTMEPTNGIAQHGDEVELKLAGWQGDASLRLALIGSKTEPSVRFTPRYRIGTKRNAPLTSNDVRNAIENAIRALADGRDRLAFANRQVSVLPREIDSVTARDDGSNTAAVRAEATRLSRQLRSAEGTIKRMERSIPTMEATIQGLEALANLARQFDQQGVIEFEVFVPCNDHELVLLTTAKGN